MSRMEIILELTEIINALLLELREYGRCNACKYYNHKDNSCHVGKVCDTKSEWAWRGIK